MLSLDRAALLRSSALLSSALLCLAAAACGDSSGSSESNAGTVTETDSTTRGDTVDATEGSATEGGSATDQGGTETQGQTSAGTDSTSATDSGATESATDSGATDSGATDSGATESATDSVGETEESSTTDGNVCADADVNFAPTVPYVQILVDQSGSMGETFDGQTRWNALSDALFDPQNGAVAQYQSQVQFGLSLYTSNGGFNGGECPIISEVAPALDNAGAMDSLYGMNGPSGDTPTGEAIDAVVPTLQGLPDDGPKVIVVATDGEPDTCEEPNPQNGQGVAVDAATNSYLAGVPVYIISVGDDISDQHLQDMANAGLGVMPGDPDAPFWKANNQQGLLDAFNTIINGVRDCKLELNGEVQDGKEEECTVTVNGQDILYNDPNGWQLNDPSEIELVGFACDAIQEGEVDVQIVCTCEAFIE